MLWVNKKCDIPRPSINSRCTQKAVFNERLDDPLAMVGERKRL